MSIFSNRRTLMPLAVAGALTTSILTAAPALASSPHYVSHRSTGGAVVANAATSRSLASYQVRRHGWGRTQYRCLLRLWNKESGWNHRARNPSSGAYGIPQALPGYKMRSAGADWRTNPNTQIRWGLNYIAARYGSPCVAWYHSQRTNWY